MRELTPELRALHDLARAASEGTYEVEDLLGRICRSVVESFGFTRASIGRYDPETGTVSPIASHGQPLEELPDEMPLDTQPVLRRALESGRAVFVRDVRADASLSPELSERFGIRSLVAVPLVSKGEPLGFLGADRGGEVFDLEEGALDVLSTMGAVAAVFAAQAYDRSALRRLDELKTNFIALAAHELRTPAAVVHGIAATLHSRDDDLADVQRRQLRKALYEQTDRLRSLVDQLLDLSRLEANAIRIVPQRFRVRRRVEEILLSLATERARDVAIEIPPELETLADPNAFDRVVANLVTNAFKYGRPPVVVTARQSDHHFRLAVEDRGEGVPREFIPELFERFSRSEDSTGSAAGAGLGLSIARSYAEAHGGDIFYGDADPSGARFELVLPVARTDVAAAEPTKPWAPAE